jgi:nitrogen fixation protein NifU and related proteins
MPLQYSKKVIENFTNPKNMGEMRNPSGIGKIGNPICGDVMWVYIKVEKKGEKEKIKDIKFKTFGCAAAIATSSMITQLAKGKDIKDAEKINPNNIAKSLKGLPPIKMHCGSMATKALALAIADYKKKKHSKI